MDFATAEIILLGNKIDMEGQKRVQLERAKKDYEWMGIKCFETSALTREGVDEAFSYLAESNLILIKKLKKEANIGL